MSVTKSQRALVVVSYLSASTKWFDGYNFIEASGMTTVDLFLSGKYSCIEKLKDSSATKTNFLNKLSTLAAKSTIKAIDVIVMTHGANNTLYFYKSSGDKMDAVGMGTLENDIKALSTGGKLRMLYSTACYGSSHNDNFVDAGFKVSVGAKGVNTNSATEFPIVLGMWGGGDKISTCIAWGEKGYGVFDAIAKLNKNWKDANSDKDVYGRGSITIDSSI
ncbi:MAG: hypothetical protein RLZZ28_2729 [Bacteroidota bacterium]